MVCASPRASLTARRPESSAPALRLPREPELPDELLDELPDELLALFLFLLARDFFAALLLARAVSTAAICCSSAGCPPTVLGALSAPLSAAEARTPLPSTMSPEKKSSALRSAGVGMGANVESLFVRASP